MVVSQHRAAVCRDEDAGAATNIVDSVIFVDTAAALGEVDAVHPAKGCGVCVCVCVGGGEERAAASAVGW